MPLMIVAAMTRLLACCALPLLLIGMSGCGGTTEESPPSGNAPPASNDSVAAAPVEPEVAAPTGEVSKGTGTLHGVITFKGDVPAPRVIQATKDPEVCSAGEGEAQDVNVKDGKLFGAVIELSIRGKDLPDFQPPADGFVLRQKDCRFAPRLLVAYDGAELVVHNDDKVPHNVNTGQWNLLQSPSGDPITQPITFGGNSFMRVTCNIHSWMESWVYVARSPFYAASNESGEFMIEGIPAGTKIRGTVTHSTLGRQKFFVDIKAGDTTEQNFEFEAK